MKKEKNKKINQERQISTKYVEVTQPCLTDLIWELFFLFCND